MTRSRITSIAATLLLSIGAAGAQAATPEFQGVSVLSTGDRVSLVFELTAEPRNVSTRRVSAAVLELDAGPAVPPSKPTSFMAPPGVRYVMGVSIQSSRSGDGGLLKARITLLERARSAVRVSGTRVYVDFSPESATLPQENTPAPAPPATPSPASGSAPAVQPPAAPTPAQSTASAAQAYRAAVQPAAERFEQLQPFLVSATASPNESVLKAVGSTLVGIQGLLLSIDVPAESRSTHDLLASAVAAAVNAVDPQFEGDRAARARQALTLYREARANW